MSTSTIIRKEIVVNGGTPISAQETLVSDGHEEISFVIAGNATNDGKEFVSNDASRVGVIITTTGEVTMKTNSSGSPDQTIVLNATNPIVWTENDVAADPLDGDINGLYFTNAAATAVTVTIILLKDTVEL